MFIIELTYQKPNTEVDKVLPAHIQYLDAHYQAGEFIASGRKNPRTGGIILCRAASKEQVMTIIQSDPFYQQEIAQYTIIEFQPTKYAAGFENFVK